MGSGLECHHSSTPTGLAVSPSITTKSNETYRTHAPDPRKKGWKQRKILCRNCVSPRSRCRPGRVRPRSSQFRNPPLLSLLGAFQKTFSKSQRKAFIETIDFPRSTSPVLQPDHPCQEASAAATARNLLDTGISHPSWRHESEPCLQASEEDAVGAAVSSRVISHRITLLTT